MLLWCEGLYRVVIVGAGISGLSIARWLTHYEDIDVVVIDKEPDVGWGVTKANTSIIHPCHEEDPNKHPLRSKLCLEGHNLWYEWVEQLDIPARWPGEIIVAFNDKQLKDLWKFVEYASITGVPGVRIVGRDEMLSLDPCINPSAVGGLYAPTAGSINPMKAAVAIAENIVENGGKFLLGAQVNDIIIEGGRVKGVNTSKGIIEADIVVNAAGIYADEISRKAGISDYSIHPRRGQYIVFSDGVDVKPRKILHTAPTQVTKGVYALTTTDGNLLIGPNAEDLSPESREDNSTTPKGLEFVYETASKLLQEIPPKSEIVKTFAGLRPEPSTGTFIIRYHEEPEGFIEVAGIRSPGLTAAPAIGNYVVKQIVEELGNVKERESWVAERRDISHPASMTPERRNEIIMQNPDYGRIVCTCRKVSVGEIMEAINRMEKIGVPYITLESIKFRTHAMYGDCQGSQCRPHIAYLIWKRLGLPPWKLLVKSKSSRYAYSEVKDLLRGDADA